MEDGRLSTKNRTSVMIFGQQYTISGTETTEHIEKVAAIVDEKMSEISSKHMHLDKDEVAVLTAVNTVNDYLKLRKQYDLLEKQFKRLKD